MEVKKWNEYSESEKQTLLNHLFTYYGKLIFNLEELEMFSYLTSKIPDTLFKIFVSSYLVGENGQTIILEVLRNEKEKQIAALKKKIDNYNAEELKEYENEFLAEIVKTYNTPEAPIPLSEEEIKRQLTKMFGI